ncbi:secreted RxLR effector protein 161-like [Cornus florida]|uniref:secreted RxLR effector protein 161-like n=1 Tax=Cornus florida TaxID=4283 RepID=UPI00289A869F|nr:secreted RxLR effector protein 161-like [Cornus florida]
MAQFEPKNVDEALQSSDWLMAIQEELLQFVKNDVWELVPRPSDVNIEYDWYLVAIRLDILFSVGVCVRYQADPREQHILTVKRIIRYVNSTLNYGLGYSSESNSEIVGYIDANWAGNKDDRKSTSGGCFYIGTNIVSWYSKKQNCISLSSCEAEYIAAGNCCT